MTMPAPELRNVVKQARLSAGLTQVELAERVEMSQRWVSSLERGDVDLPPVRTLQRLADALHISVTDLFIAAQIARTRADAQRIADTMIGPGQLREERAELDDAIDPDEYAVRRVLRELPHEDRLLLVEVAEVFARRHRGRFE